MMSTFLIGCRKVKRLQYVEKFFMCFVNYALCIMHYELISNPLDYIRHNPPNLEMIFLGDFDGREGGVMRHQEKTAVFEVDALEGELPFDEADGNMIVGRFQRLVYHHDVAILNADTFHAVSGDAGVECGGLVFDDVTVEVEHRLGIVLGRGGESGVDTFDYGNLVVMGMRGEDVKVGHD